MKKEEKGVLISSKVLFFIFFGLSVLFACFRDFINENSGFFNILAIFVAILIFQKDMEYKEKNHNSEQKKLLDQLHQELKMLVGKRILGGKEYGGHLDFFKKGVTDHLAYKIDINYYLANMDKEIDGNTTIVIISALQILNDKIDLINFYMGQMRAHVFEKYMGKTGKNLKDVKKDKFITSLRAKLKGPLGEAEHIAKKLDEALIRFHGVGEYNPVFKCYN